MTTATRERPLRVSREQEVPLEPSQGVAAVHVRIIRPNLQAEGGVALSLQCDRELDTEIEDAVVEAVRIAVLQRAQHKAGGLPPGGLSVEVSLQLPGWEAASPLVRRGLPGAVAYVTGLSVEDSLR